MPELPEVETTRRLLTPGLVGRRVTEISVPGRRVLRLQDPPAAFSERLVGRRIRRLDRRGKFLLARLDGDLTWVIHLGMSGRLTWAEEAETTGYVTLRIGLDGGARLRFVDPRTFGFSVVWTAEELAASTVARLGPDAADALPSTTELRRRLAGRTAPVKALLLEQRFLAGIGNIYADEALHRAGLAPRRPGGSLRPEEVGRLRSAIREVLAAGIAAGGTSLGDLAYLLPDGRAGGFLPELRVYGRAGSPCPACGGEVRRDVVRGRGTHWCGRCQR